MKKIGVAAAIVASLAIAPAWLGSGSLQAATAPPTNLKKVGDHWTPWDPPAAGPGAYVIQKGDNLWDLAGKWLGDPFLWPQVWDENRYILDSHWIYPGDPLVVPGMPTVVPEGGPPPIEVPDEDPRDVRAEVVPPAPPAPPPLLPVADMSDIYCSGYVDPDHEYSDLWVGGRPDERIHLGLGDVMYLSHGKNRGLKPGDEFAVRRETRDVSHPATGQKIGSFVRRLGKVRIMLAHETTSTAVVEMACEDIQMSDELVPWQDIPIPMRSALPSFERWNPDPSGGPRGQIVSLNEGQTVAATGQIIHVDLGRASGVRPGEVLTLFQDRIELPRLNIGQAVVLTVEPLTATAKITRAVRETGVGDLVEVAR